MTHPLTDDLAGDLIFRDNPYGNNIKSFMRAATDWQLEQGIEWLNDNVSMLLLSTESELGYRYLESLQKEFIQDFKQAMRPQGES